MRRRLLRDVVTTLADRDPEGAAAGADWIDQVRAACAHFHNLALDVPQLRSVHAARASELESKQWRLGESLIDLDDQAIAARREELRLLGRLIDAFEAAEAERRKRGWLGFDELLIEPIDLLRRDERVRAICRDAHRHIVVDEYQDTNPAQADLLSLISPPERAGDLVVVGDDDQSIYGFRGADDLAFDHFAKRWRGCAQVRLGRNYRSAPPVIEAANAVMQRAFHRFDPDKVIEPGRDDHPGDARIELVQLGDFRTDSEVIAHMIARERTEHDQRTGESKAFNQFAVIVRTHGDAERITQALRLAGVPAQSQRQGAVASDPGVRRLLAWVELLSDPGASWAARSVLGAAPIFAPADARIEWERQYAADASRLPQGTRPKGFAAWLVERASDDTLQEDDAGKEAMDAAKRFCALYTSLQALAREETAERLALEIIQRAGLAESELLAGRARATRVRHLVTAIGFVRALQPRLPEPGDVSAFWSYYQDLDPGEQSMGAAMGEEAIDSDEVGALASDEDAVQVITAHSAKGLEFDTVFVPRVAPPWGYPLSRQRENPVPAGVLPEGDDVRTPKEQQYDEERRLFYVALTRAERRAVLLTVKTARPSKSVHFAQQLAADMGARLAVIDERDVLDAPPDARDHELAAASDIDDDAARTQNRQRSARLQAARALALAESSQDDASLESAIALLRQAAEAVASQGRGPVWRAPEQAASDDVAMSAMDDNAGAIVPSSTGRTSPLKLSYTAIASYLRCPRCWHLQSVLRLPEASSDASVVGKATHLALQRVYEKLRDAEALGEPPPVASDINALSERAYLSLTPADRVVERSAIEHISAMARTAHESLHEPHAELLEIEHTLTVPWPNAGEGSTMQVRLDRLDRLGSAHRIVDYKTGKPRKALVQPPAKDLQFGIYAMALDTAMPDVDGVAEYWVLRSGERGRIALSDLDRSWAAAEVGKAVDGMRLGQIAPTPGCAACAWLDASVAPALSATPTSVTGR